ncbi:SIMPL domain-containing protein [Ornithinimicrobium sp. W1679]|uniref:SIMPL domain-containing protein n=1 Tax=unclassified Ornithinimicrobium TaxID=2615080 RepID=UPI003CEDEC71
MAATDDDRVEVTGTGRASGRPDTLVLDLRLQAHGATVGEALTSLTRASHACHDALPGLPVRTHGLGVHPRHEQGHQRGHTAHQSLQVRTDDPSLAGDLVQRLVDVVGDALGVDGLRHELADTAALARRAREQAFADAAVRAQQYAALSGRTLGAVRRVREPGGSGPSPMAAELARTALSAGPVVQAEDLEVVAAVEVVWELVG